MAERCIDCGTPMFERYGVCDDCKADHPGPHYVVATLPTGERLVVLHCPDYESARRWAHITNDRRRRVGEYSVMAAED